MSSQEEQQVGRGAVSMEKNEKIQKVRKEAGKGVCKIITSKGNATGALYRVVDKNARVCNLLISCQHVLQTNSIREIMMTKFMFDDLKNVKEMESVTLKKADVKYVWISSLLDATVIEISHELAARFTNYGAKFLQVGKVTQPPVDVVIIQYPNGVFSIADGEIESIEGNKVVFQIGTEPGSSGSPLLNLNGVALALHQTGPVGVPSTIPFERHTATVLSAVVDAYLEERPDFEPEVTTRTAPAPLTLKLQHRWSAAQLYRSNEKEPNIAGLAAGSSEAELFLADYANGVARLFDMGSGQLAEARYDVYRSPRDAETVRRVEYSARTDTIFTCTLNQDSRTYLTVRSFRRRTGTQGDEVAWRECFRFDVANAQGCGAMRVMSDGSSLVLAVAVLKVGRTMPFELRVLEVAADDSRALHCRAGVPLPDETDLGTIDAKLVGRKTWFAYAVRDVQPAKVVLCRVVEEANVTASTTQQSATAEELSHCELREPRRLLFCGDDSLLVYSRTADAKGWQVHELSIGIEGGSLESRRVLLSGSDIPGTVWLAPEWCITNDSLALVAWNVEYQTLTTYSLK